MIIISKIQKEFLKRKPGVSHRQTKKKTDDSPPRSFKDTFLNETKDYDPYFVLNYFSKNRGKYSWKRKYLQSRM